MGDLRDPDYLDRVLVGIDIICHAAGWSSFENSGNQSNNAYLEPTLDLINRAIEWRVSRFVNLSSLFVAPAKQRDNANAIGKPRAYWPMINCMIGVENFLKAYGEQNINSRCQFINLRLGIYSGKRLNMGLIPLLLARSGLAILPYINGHLGHLPLVDGRDIGQAFVRAALAPFETSYTSINIAGPSTPAHSEIIQFIEEQTHLKLLSPGLPSTLASSILWLQGKAHRFNRLSEQLNGQPLFTTAMLDMLKSPVITNTQSENILGYDPKISWQASLLDTLELHKKQSLNHNISQLNRALNLN